MHYISYIYIIIILNFKYLLFLYNIILQSTCSSDDFGFVQIPEGEDEASFSRHKQALKSKAKKIKPNRAAVSELMKLSFHMRRNDITSCARPVGELLEDYPFLGDPKEVIVVLYRII